MPLPPIPTTVIGSLPKPAWLTGTWYSVVERWNLDEADFELDRVHRRIVAYCRERGIACLDLAPAFRRAAAGENLYLPYDEHFNESGHRVASAGLSGGSCGAGLGAAARPGGGQALHRAGGESADVARRGDRHSGGAAVSDVFAEVFAAPATRDALRAYRNP